jgi:prevent-host-death family protein
MLNVQNLVSISDFRQNLSTWLNKVKADQSVVILQNSKPKAVIIDPEYLTYLENYANGYYDAGDVAEIKRMKANGEDKKVVPFSVNDYL